MNSFPLSLCSVERQIIHNIVEATRLEAGGSKHYNLRVLSLNVVSVSEANHSSLETNSLIAMEAPQVHKLCGMLNGAVIIFGCAMSVLF